MYVLVNTQGERQSPLVSEARSSSEQNGLWYEYICYHFYTTLAWDDIDRLEQQGNTANEQQRNTASHKWNS